MVNPLWRAIWQHPREGEHTAPYLGELQRDRESLSPTFGASQSLTPSVNHLSSGAFCKESRHPISVNILLHGGKERNRVASVGLVHTGQCRPPLQALPLSILSRLLSHPQLFRSALFLGSCQQCFAYQLFSTTKTGACVYTGNLTALPSHPGKNLPIL